ncbi:cytochrome c1 [Asticcacaulis solisilvae]|uniref:cytochrome c1 n=1 Tax=Asticcacaulis solisilvae TaxID=1217274 RepID=UPI003FD746F9
MSILTKSLKALSGAVLAVSLMAAPHSIAAENFKEPEAPKEGFSFEGPFGTFDQAQLQRGYKVYREVCSACHSMKLLSFRNLAQKDGPFYDEKYKNPNDNPIVKQIASEYDIPTIDPDTGDETTRKGTPSDRFVSPFKNDEAAKASNGGALPPDLSVMAKAREGGARYIYSILTGFRAPPAGLTVADTQHYNPYVHGSLATQWKGDPKDVPPGGVLAMPPPLADGRVTFDDGRKSTLDNEAADVATFLEWASDPHAVERKQTGFAVIIYLLLMAGVTYIAYRQVWKGKH